MNISDIHFAFRWFEWRKNAKSRKYSREYIDRYAFSQFDEAFLYSPYISDAAKTKGQALMADVDSATFGTGAADYAITYLCQFIIRGAEEGDFVTLLERNPRKISDWRKLWNKIRGTTPKRRRRKGVQNVSKKEKEN